MSDLWCAIDGGEAVSDPQPLPSPLRGLSRGALAGPLALPGLPPHLQGTCWWPVVEGWADLLIWQRHGGVPVLMVDTGQRAVRRQRPAEDLPVEDARVAAIAAVRAEAERRRQLWITPGLGKTLEYREKVDELRGYRAAGDPDPEDYPLMAAEAAARGISLAAQADMIEAAYTAWRQIGAALAAIEAGAVAAIEAAESTAALRDIWTGIDWSGTAPA